MVYLYLFLAIISETIATTAIKASEQFTRLVPSLIVVVFYAISFYLLSIVLKTIQLGITYAIWSSLGIVLVSIFAAILYKQMPDIPAIIGIVLILAGVITINLFSKSVSH